MASITLGVGALVAIHSFRADVERSIRAESRALLGADLRFERNQPYEASTLRVVDSLAATGATVSRVTTLMSMVYAPRRDLSRLVQVRGTEGGFPLYGTVRTEPEGLWASGIAPGVAVVDPVVLVQLGLEVGDTVRIGAADFAVGGTVEGLPTDLGFQTAVGPRVFVAAEELERTELLTFGSLARYQVFFRFDDEGAARRIQRRYDDDLRAQAVDSDTAGELAGNLTEGLETLSRFLGLVGLVALLLGGVGVASAIHVYVKERLDAVAVLRCIGATERDVFLAYLLQTGVLGLLGAAAGVLLGLVVQLALPLALRGVLPVEVEAAFHPGPVVAGLAAGVWIAAIFAFIPLLGLREATPLQALRRDFGDGRGAVVVGGGDPLRLAAYGALGASVLAVSVWQAPSVEIGLGFAASLVACLGLLFLCAHGLMAAMQRFFPRGAAYPVRHGISNLFRPRNQTVTVVLALGFGAFLVAAVGQVRVSILDRLTLDAEEERPNVLLFDIQADQEGAVESALREVGATSVSITPVVPARLAAVKGRTVEDLLAQDRRNRPPRWVLSRLYRNTFRADRDGSDELVAGAWWDETDEATGEPTSPGGGSDAGGRPSEPYGISIAADLSEELDVGVGDHLTWDVQGALLESEVRSIRAVEWARFQPNFYVIFEPGAIDDAPRMSVALARVPRPETRMALQSTLVRRFPNISVLDLEEVQAILDQILGRAADAVRFIAAFSMVAGLLVLAGALATSRFQRLREGALLRTLGARRGQILWIVFSEYLALGAVAGAAGVLLGVVGGWLVVRYVFEIGFRLDPVPLLWLWLVLTVLTAVVGVLGSRGVLRNPPLVILRRTAE